MSINYSFEDAANRCNSIATLAKALANTANLCKDSFDIYRIDPAGWWMHTPNKNSIGVHLETTLKSTRVTVTLNASQKFVHIVPSDNTVKDIMDAINSCENTTTLSEHVKDADICYIGI